MKEYESDIDKERQSKRDLEKQLKDLKSQHDSSHVLIKTSQLSSDELKVKLAEMGRRVQGLEIDLERKNEELLKANEELQE